MRQAYRKFDIEAEWLKSKSEELAEAMLRKDVEQNNAKAFALHASAYAAYVDASGIPSRLSGYLERELENWVRKVDRHVAAGEYEAAISLYEALAGFRDMSANIEAVRITWAASDPSLLLPEGTIRSSAAAGTGSAPKSTPWRSIRSGAYTTRLGTAKRGRRCCAASRFRPETPCGA